VLVRHIAATGAAIVLALLLGVPAAAVADPDGAGWTRLECRPFSATGVRTSSTCGATLDGGRAVAPGAAPQSVKDVIKFANHIRGRPYVWGGGHASWRSHGYDCSGAVGYALHGAGLLERTMVSGELEYWGDAGYGRWITVYANYHHVYMVIAGLRFDTRDPPPGVSGPRWHPDMPPEPSRSFTARHPAGL
jgi:hypothetical protein